MRAMKPENGVKVKRSGSFDIRRVPLNHNIGDSVSNVAAIVFSTLQSAVGITQPSTIVVKVCVCFKIGGF